MKVVRCITVLLAVSLIANQPTHAEAANDTARRLAELMNEASTQGFTGAVIVARGDEILLEKGYGKIDPDEDRPVTPDTVFTTGSITKQFTAAAIMKLEEMGQLSVSDPIAKYLEGVPPDKTSITIHQLLSHQAGFPGAIGDDMERVGRDGFVTRALQTPLQFEPGTSYEYSNVGFSLAAAIVEIVSGTSYEEFLDEHLFRPAGMKDTGYHIPRWDPSRLAHGVTDEGNDWGTMVDRTFSNGGPGWHLVGNGGIQSTVRDMLRWHRALMGDRILTAASKKKMYARHADEGGGTWYGYGWSIEPTPWGEAITHNGGNPYFFSDFLRFPKDVVIYYSTSSRDRRMKRLARKLAQIVFTDTMPAIEPKPEAMMTAGDAPKDSTAATWGFPGSYRGMRAAEMLEAIVHGDESARRSFLESGFEPGVIERNGVDRLLGMFDRLKEDMGTFEARGVRPAGESRVVIVIDREEGPPMQIILDLEPGEPHRIRGVEVEIGD